jgi:hypothetical protein
MRPPPVLHRIMLEAELPAREPDVPRPPEDFQECTIFQRLRARETSSHATPADRKFPTFEAFLFPGEGRGPEVYLRL